MTCSTRRHITGRQLEKGGLTQNAAIDSADAALTKLSGVTEIPWPKAMVITLTSRHFAGKCGAATSDISIFGAFNSPSRARKSRCLWPPAAIAILAAPIFDEYIRISGTFRTQCLP